MLGKFLYLACEDGTIKILKVRKNKIELVKSLFKVDNRCLCLDPIQSTSDEKQLARYIFSGYSDSSIRKWDLQSGNSILQF